MEKHQRRGAPSKRKAGLSINSGKFQVTEKKDLPVRGGGGRRPNRKGTRKRHHPHRLKIPNRRFVKKKTPQKETPKERGKRTRGSGQRRRESPPRKRHTNTPQARKDVSGKVPKGEGFVKKTRAGAVRFKAYSVASQNAELPEKRNSSMRGRTGTSGTCACRTVETA